MHFGRIWSLLGVGVGSIWLLYHEKRIDERGASEITEQ